MNSSDRNLNKAFLRNTKCWMSLRSKSIQGMNSRILKVFELKLSIFTRHKHPSFSRILHIMFRFCCIVTFKKQPRVVWRKRCQFRFSHCFVANLLHNIVVLDTNAFQVFSRDIIYFSTTFVSEYHSKLANQTSRNRN